MKGKILVAVASGLLAATIAGCSQPNTTAPAATEQKIGDMAAATATAVVAGPIRSTGVVTQVDAHAGTVTFNHEVIPAINWPAMTMQFHAEESSILHGIAVGDHVTFELKSASEPQTVTVVHKQ
jgi:Cu(I)/Ag(I) efflux system protein CusF